jgi:hypothetical protein
MIKNREEIKIEAKCLWPVRMSDGAIRAFLKKTKSFEPEELSAAWEERKKRHLSECQDRYGLNDRYPFLMVPGEVAFTVRWDCTEGEYNMEFIPNHEPRFTISGFDENPLDVVKSRIGAYCERLGLPPVNLFDLGSFGGLKIFEQYLPEHDWHKWRDEMVYRYGKRPLSVTKAISKYRKGNLPGVEDLEQLEQFIGSLP